MHGCNLNQNKAIRNRKQFLQVSLVFIPRVHQFSPCNCVFPAGMHSMPAGPKIVLVPPDLFFCPHLKIIMPFIHIVLDDFIP